jgi:hypothetical protein
MIDYSNHYLTVSIRIGYFITDFQELWLIFIEDTQGTHYLGRC